MNQSPVPNTLLESMAAAADRAGLAVPELSRFAPAIDLSRGIRAIALDLGRLLAPRNIFLQNDTIVTVDASTGVMRPMRPTRFPGWCEEFCVFIAPGSRRERETISVDAAAQILDQDIFQSCLRPLNAVCTMRLPTLRPSGAVEWLESGYDAASGIYTVDLLPYDMDQALGDAQGFLLETFGEFPWNKKDGEAKGLHNNRSFSVLLAGLVGAYCRQMFPPGTLMPILAFFANKPGTGKTRLAESVQCPVFGRAFGTGAPKDEEKWEVKLETIAQSMQPFAFFDDIGRGLRSNALNRFTSEAGHAGRKFHSNSAMFAVPNVTQVIITANDLKTSEDLGRRSLVAELFLDVEVKGRKFARVITNKWLQDDKTRAAFLEALCSLLKNWIASGMPRHQNPIPTYEEWTEIIGGIVMAADFADPLLEPEGDVGGAMDEDEVKQLLIIAAGSQEGDGELSRKDLIEVARANGLMADLLGREGEVDDSVSKAFGRRMQKWRGQKITDRRGRKFQFSHKKGKLGLMSYPLAFLPK